MQWSSSKISAWSSSHLAVRRRNRVMGDRIEGGIRSGRLVVVLTRIVVCIQVFEAQWADGRYLSHVLAGLRPMEVPGIAGQNDDAARRIGFHCVAIEPLAEPDIKYAGHDRVDPILRVFVRHQFHSGRYLNPDDIRARLGGLTNDDSEPHRWWKRSERFPVDVFRQDGLENRLARLMGSRHVILLIQMYWSILQTDASDQLGVQGDCSIEDFRDRAILLGIAGKLGKL